MILIIECTQLDWEYRLIVNLSYAKTLFSGVVFCPLVCLIMTIGNSAIILGLWPLHIVKTYYSILRFFLCLKLFFSLVPDTQSTYSDFSYLLIGRTKHIGPVLKIVLCICLPATLILWLVLGIVGSIIGGALYGFLSPIFATFDAVGERKTNMLYHCFYVCLKYQVLVIVFSALYPIYSFLKISLFYICRMELWTL